MIAVIGATGNTGQAAVKELKALGENPLCIVRNPAKAAEVLGADAKIAVAEISDREAMKKALTGVKKVFLVTGHNPQSGDQQINVLEAAKAAGVEFLVKVSGGKALVGPDSESVVGRGHHQVEEALKKSGLGWVILRPGLFMQNTLAQAAVVKAENKLALPFARDLPLAFIDTRDSGALGAHVVRSAEKHAGKTYEYTGSLSNYDEFAKVFSDVLGRPITYIGVSPEQAATAMKARGMPDWLVTHLTVIAQIAAKGAFSTENKQPILEIVGRPPLTTRQFVETYRGAFS